jgi:hypothetical protein
MPALIQVFSVCLAIVGRAYGTEETIAGPADLHVASWI